MLAIETDMWQANTRQQELDEALIERWESVHEQHMMHRRAAAARAETMRKLAPDYQAAIRRAQAQYDAEHARYDAGEAAARYLLNGKA